MRCAEAQSMPVMTIPVGWPTDNWYICIAVNSLCKSVQGMPTRTVR